jgi:hypothetical protein
MFESCRAHSPAKSGARYAGAMTTFAGFAAIGEPQRPTLTKPASAADVSDMGQTPCPKRDDSSTATRFGPIFRARGRLS